MQKKLLLLIISLIAASAVLLPVIALAQTPPPPKGYVPLITLPDPRSGNALTTDLPSYLNGIFRIGIGAAAVLAMFTLVLGGFIYMSTDSIGGKEEGKRWIGTAIGGLLLALFAYLILYTINPELTKFKLPNVVVQVTINPAVLSCKSEAEKACLAKPGGSVTLDSVCNALTNIPPKWHPDSVCCQTPGTFLGFGTLDWVGPSGQCKGSTSGQWYCSSPISSATFANESECETQGRCPPGNCRSTGGITAGNLCKPGQCASGLACGNETISNINCKRCTNQTSAPPCTCQSGDECTTGTSFKYLGEQCSATDRCVNSFCAVQKALSGCYTTVTSGFGFCRAYTDPQRCSESGGLGF